LTPFSDRIIISLKAQGAHSKTDSQLIEASKNGDKAAFTNLVRRYEDVVYRFAYKVCRNDQDARETLQDTFISVYRNLGSFDGRSKITTWLYRIVTNNCLMKRRRQTRDAVLESYDEPPIGVDGKHREHILRWEETPVDRLMRQELREALDRAITKLPVDYRVVFVLRDVEGKSTEETAKILKISVEATKSRLRRARAFLRDQLGPYMTSRRKVNA
jgi:RNA polymerase sigma-70 factor (ECF subfamily)